MITPKIKAELKKFLKSDYSEDVLKILNDSNITSRKGEPYSASAVKNVLNGNLENIDIEKALTVVYLQRKKIHNKHQRALKNAIIP